MNFYIKLKVSRIIQEFFQQYKYSLQQRDFTAQYILMMQFTVAHLFYSFSSRLVHFIILYDVLNIKHPLFVTNLIKLILVKVCPYEKGSVHWLLLNYAFLDLVYLTSYRKEKFLTFMNINK